MYITLQDLTRNVSKKIMKFFQQIGEFSVHVKNNIGKTFLILLEKHFPSSHCLRKICNKNTVKISYSCMPNMAAILSGYFFSIFIFQTRRKASEKYPSNNHPYQLPKMPRYCCPVEVIFIWFFNFHFKINVAV